MQAQDRGTFDYRKTPNSTLPNSGFFGDWVRSNEPKTRMAGSRAIVGLRLSFNDVRYSKYLLKNCTASEAKFQASEEYLSGFTKAHGNPN